MWHSSSSAGLPTPSSAHGEMVISQDESLIFTPGTPSTAYLVTVTPERFVPKSFPISNRVQLTYNPTRTSKRWITDYALRCKIAQIRALSCVS